MNVKYSQWSGQGLSWTGIIIMPPGFPFRLFDPKASYQKACLMHITSGFSARLITWLLMITGLKPIPGVQQFQRLPEDPGIFRMPQGQPPGAVKIFCTFQTPCINGAFFFYVWFFPNLFMASFAAKASFNNDCTMTEPRRLFDCIQL